MMTMVPAEAQVEVPEEEIETEEDSDHRIRETQIPALAMVQEEV